MFYADDTQLYIAANPKHDNPVGLILLESCMNNIEDWMQVNHRDNCTGFQLDKESFLIH